MSQMFNLRRQIRIWPMQHQNTNQKASLKICAVSDTHGEYYTLKDLVKEQGDILIIAGDFTYYGNDADFDKFIHFLDALKGWRYKIVISGNHEIVLDNNLDPQTRLAYNKQYPCKYSRHFLLQEINKRAIYLEHQFVEIEGLKIFGSPFTTYYCGSAFQIPPQKLKKYWDLIPQNLDILITHGPPFGIFDLTAKKVNAGCQHLLQKVKEVKPKIHIYGHIHQGRAKFGQSVYKKVFDTRFYNVAHKPTIIQFQQAS